jgi:hypothetical protein
MSSAQTGTGVSPCHDRDGKTMTRFDHNRLRPVPLCTSLISVATAIWHSPRKHRTGGLVRF